MAPPGFDPLAAPLRRLSLWKVAVAARIPTMQDHSEHENKSTESQPELGDGSFTAQDADCRGRATEHQNAGGESVAGCPAQRTIRNATYNSDRHNFSDRSSGTESSPSAGWRAVYEAMGASIDADR